ncbi:MAG: helix-turn-helix domain-containing protein [Sporomusa sp.]
METLGERIKRLRNKLTQEELAVILKVERSTLASWEVNRREPDIATLCRLADFFKVSIDWLVCHTPSQTAYPSTANKFQETTGLYQAVSDKRWEKVIKIAQTYGYDPDSVFQLLELNAKIALSLKDNNEK